jgi:hypothetical protein
MSGEATVDSGQEGQDINDEHDDGTDADFEAGLNGTPTVTPGSTDEAVKKEDGDSQQSAAPAGEQPAVPPAEQTPEPEFVQITRTQFDDILRKAGEVDNLKANLQQTADRVYGKIGGVERILKDLREQPAGQPLKLSEDDFAELKAEFPDLAALHMKGMQRMLEKLPLRAAAVDPEAIEKVVQERTATVRTEVIDSRLDEIIDGDWREEVKKPEFDAWLSKQADDVKALGESSSLRDAAKMIRLYKAHRDAPPPQPTPAPAPAASPTRSRVLAAAVAPKGTVGKSPASPSDDDDFEAGLKYQRTG